MHSRCSGKPKFMKHTSRRRLEDGNPFSCFLLFRFTREMKCCLDVIHKPCIRLSGPLCSLCRGRCESKTPLIWRSWRAGDQTGTHSVHYCCRLETPADCRTALMFDNLHCNWNFFLKKRQKNERNHQQLWFETESMYFNYNQRWLGEHRNCLTCKAALKGRKVRYRLQQAPSFILSCLHSRYKWFWLVKICQSCWKKTA